jgi:hypothetical protein
VTGARAALAALAAALVLAAAPELAHACAVCTGKDDAAFSIAMLKGTALLSLLPLAVFGGGAWYLRRRARQIAAAEAERDAAGRHAPRATGTA